MKWCKDSLNEADGRLTGIESYLQDVLPDETQKQIGLTLMKVVGDRKKYKHRILQIMEEFTAGRQ